MYKAKSSKELWAFLFNDFLLLTHTGKQFTSSLPDKLFSNKNNVQLKMYKPVRHVQTHAENSYKMRILTFHLMLNNVSYFL